MNNILSYTYLHFIVLVSYLIAHCTVMDHLKLRKFAYLSATRDHVPVASLLECMSDIRQVTAAPAWRKATDSLLPYGVAA